MTVLELGNQFTFIFFSPVAEKLERVGFGNVGTDNLGLTAGEFKHLVLDFCKIIRSDGVACGVDVIIETVFNGRADAEFHAGIEFLQRLGKEVGRRVPESMLALGVVPFEKFQGRVGADGTRKIPLGPVDRCGKDVLGKAGTD